MLPATFEVAIERVVRQLCSGKLTIRQLYATSMKKVYSTVEFDVIALFETVKLYQSVQ